MSGRGYHHPATDNAAAPDALPTNRLINPAGLPGTWATYDEMLRDLASDLPNFFAPSAIARAAVDGAGVALASAVGPTTAATFAGVSPFPGVATQLVTTKPGASLAVVGYASSLYSQNTAVGNILFHLYGTIDGNSSEIGRAAVGNMGDQQRVPVIGLGLFPVSPGTHTVALAGYDENGLVGWDFYGTAAILAFEIGGP